MRAFLAVALPEPVRRQLGTIAERCVGRARADWRAVRPEALHLTLRFLGDVHEALDARARPTWREACAGVGSFRMVLAELGVFPRGTRPRVLWIGADEPEGRLRALAAGLEAAARAVGFPADTRPLRPHVTLARAARGARPRAPTTERPGPIEVGVDDVVLFASHLEPRGARYTALEHFPLGGVRA